MNIAIITGASSGLGREFALQLDREKLDGLWLVARRVERLRELQARLSTDARVLALDCADPAAIESLDGMLAREKPAVRWMVNCAGFGRTGDFARLPRDRQLAMIDVNVRALTHLSHIAAAYMTAGSCFVQVASSAGFAPLGGFAVYAATKAYVIFLSMALSAELRPRGIHSIAVCPGPVKTGFSDISRAGSDREKALFTREADPVPVVRRALADARARRHLSVYGAGTRLTLALSKLLPHRLIAVLSERFIYRRKQ